MDIQYTRSKDKIICNSDDYAEIERVTGKQVQVGETIMKVKK